MNIKNTYQREIERKPLNNIIFSIGLAFVIILITIILGLRPISLALTKNRKYKSELVEIKNNMEIQINKINESRESILSSIDKVEILNNKIPDEPNFQNFLEDLVVVTSNSQFIIQQARRHAGAESSEKATIDLRLKGDVENLPNLLHDLENEMPRFISMTKLRTQEQKEENDELVEINMEIYTLK